MSIHTILLAIIVLWLAGAGATLLWQYRTMWCEGTDADDRDGWVL